LPMNQLAIPAHSTMQVLVTVNVPDAGVYTVTGSADSQSSSATDSSPATLTVVITNQAPVVDAGVGQEVDEGTAVSFNGTASDPDTDPFDILWRFGDGSSAAGSLTPSHTFGDNGVYNVTLTVTDTGSLASTDNVLITVNNVAPTVNAGADLSGGMAEAIQFNGSFTDPGTLDTHTIEWDFGDGQTATGTLTPEHFYAASGEYTVTLTVTDDDGGISSDTLTVLVEYRVLLPIIIKQ
jgi:PKD repeat protein